MAKKINKPVKVVNKGSQLEWVLFVAYFGAAVYFVQHSHGFWGFVLALLKAAVWPAFLLHKALY